MSGKATGFDRAASLVREVGSQLSEEHVIREGLHHAAGEPLAAEMKQNIQKLTGRTAEDIRVVDIPSRADVAAIKVGGTRGKGGRGYIGSFLEWGTSKMAARPWARPAYDVVEPGVGARLAAFVRERLASITRGRV